MYIFMSLIVLYFLHGTSVLSFYIGVVLILYIRLNLSAPVDPTSYQIKLVSIGPGNGFNEE